MASTYSPRLKLELIASGEQANSWGDTTNSTWQKSIDESISGVYSVNLGGASSPRNLSNTQGGSATADGEWRQAALRFYGHTTAFVIRQQDVGSTKERIYTIINDGTDNGTIQMQLTTNNSSIIIPPGGRAVLATNGTDWYTIIPPTIQVAASSNATWRSISAATDNVFAGEKILVNTTSNAITLTLPASPVVGDEVRFLDERGTFDNNALTIARNGQPIYGATADMTVSTEDAAFSLVFTGASQGWKLTEK